MIDREHDLLVVGCGMFGATMALLARVRFPRWSVLVVDRDRPGAGATGWSAGLSDPTFRDARRRQLLASSAALFGRPPLSRFVTRLPALAIVDADAVERLAGMVAGPPLVSASDDELAWLRRVHPDLAIRPGEVVLSIPSGLLRVACDGVLGALAGHGIDVWAGCTAERAERRADGWVVTTATGAEIRAARVAVATGPWASPRTEADGVTLADPRFRAKRVAALHVRTPTPTAEERVIAIPAEHLFILPARPHTIVSFHRNAWLADGEPPTGRFDDGDLAEGVAALRRRIPSLADRVVGGRAAYDAYTDDGEPLVDTRAAPAGLVRLVGGSGRGAHLAPGVAAAAIHALTDADRLEADHA